MDPNTQVPQQPIQPTPPPITPEPIQTPKRSPLLWVIVALLLIIVLGGVGGTMYLQNQLKSKMAVSDAKKMVPPTETVTPTISLATSPTPSATTSSTTVTIESEATLPVQDVSELQARVINPFKDYFAESRPNDVLLQIKIMKNVQNQAGFPYVLDSLSQDGIKQGSVISRTDGHLDWWFPECQMGCQLSDAFKAKYPEIAKKVQ